MARTNKAVKTSVFQETRLAGGMGMGAAVQSPENELRRLVMTCLLWEDLAYQDGRSVVEDIKAIVPKVSPEKVYEITVATRKEQKLRHVPLLLIREMCRYPEHRKFVHRAIQEVCTRPDQMGELLSIYWKSNNGKKSIPNQMKSGLAEAFNNFDEYQLSKWNRDAEIKLRDVMFLVHPKPSSENQANLFNKLAQDTLAPAETWEVKLSAARNDAEKAAVWNDLIERNKLGALAILRNLRNMQQVLPKPTVRKAIAQAKPDMLLPIDFVKAFDYAGDFVKDLEALMFKCLAQFPKLKGETLFVLDVSGSMQCPVSAKSQYTRIDAGVAMAMMAIEMSESCSFYLTAGGWGSHKTEKVVPHRGFGLIPEVRNMIPKMGGGGIFTRQCLEHLSKVEKTPDRIIVFSDSQDCDGANRTPKPFGDKNYIVDVSNHRNGVNYKGIWTAEISGWSEHFLRFIAELENNG